MKDRILVRSAIWDLAHGDVVLLIGSLLAICPMTMRVLGKREKNLSMNDTP